MIDSVSAIALFTALGVGGGIGSIIRSHYGYNRPIVALRDCGMVAVSGDVTLRDERSAVHRLAADKTEADAINSITRSHIESIVKGGFEKALVETEDQKAERKEREVEMLFLKAQQDDLADMLDAHDWTPHIEIQKAANGLTFLRYDGDEVIADYIEAVGIAVSSGTRYAGDGHVMRDTPRKMIGNAPFKFVGHRGPGVKGAAPGVVEITMVSGKKHHWKASRHKIDILLASVTHLWHEARKGTI